MKKLLSLFIVGLSLTAFGDSLPILLYGFGSQITYTRLTIDADGNIEREEKRGGGSPFEKQLSVRLSAQARDTLLESLDTIDGAGERTFDGQMTLLGSSSGELILFQSGKEIIVKRVERGGKPGSKDKVTVSKSSSAAAWVESLVNSYAENKMYQTKW